MTINPKRPASESPCTEFATSRECGYCANSNVANVNERVTGGWGRVFEPPGIEADPKARILDPSHASKSRDSERSETLCQLNWIRLWRSSRPSSTCAKAVARIEHELSKVIIGQQEVTEQLLIRSVRRWSLLDYRCARGWQRHCLVRSIAQIFHLKFRRIQFTPRFDASGYHRH